MVKTKNKDQSMLTAFTIDLEVTRCDVEAAWITTVEYFHWRLMIGCSHLRREWPKKGGGEGGEDGLGAS